MINAKELEMVNKLLPELQHKISVLACLEVEVLKREFDYNHNQSCNYIKTPDEEFSFCSHMGEYTIITSYDHYDSIDYGSHAISPHQILNYEEEKADLEKRLRIIKSKEKARETKRVNKISKDRIEVEEFKAWKKKKNNV